MLKKETDLKLCDINNRIGKNIGRIRKEKGLSSHELARMSGVPYINRIENGSKPIGKQGIIRLAQALNVDIAELYRPLTRTQKTDQLLLVFDHLTAEGQSLLIETAKSIAAYEARLKWRE